MSEETNTTATALAHRLSLLLALVLLLGGCASTERMMRITPFSAEEVSDPDRVNLWPLFHRKTGPEMSRTRLFPLFSREVKDDEATTSALAWTFKLRNYINPLS